MAYDAFYFSEAARLINPWLLSDVFHSTISIDEVTAMNMLQFEDVGEGQTVYSYNRYNTYGNATSATATPTTGSVVPSAATFTNVTQRLQVYTDIVEIPRVESRSRTKLDDQLKAKAYVVGRGFSTDLAASAAQADTTLGVPGYGALVIAGQTISANDTSITGTLTLTKLDELADNVKVGDPAKKAYIMPSKTRRSLRALLITAGVQPETIMLANFDGRNQPAYNGIPIFKNEFLATNIVQGGAASVNTSKLYCLSFDNSVGMFGFYPGSQIFNVTQPYEVPNKPAIGYKVEFWVGVGLKNNYGAACMVGVSN